MYSTPYGTVFPTAKVFGDSRVETRLAWAGYAEQTLAVGQRGRHPAVFVVSSHQRLERLLGGRSVEQRKK